MSRISNKQTSSKQMNDEQMNNEQKTECAYYSEEVVHVLKDGRWTIFLLPDVCTDIFQATSESPDIYTVEGIGTLHGYTTMRAVDIGTVRVYQKKGEKKRKRIRRIENRICGYVAILEEEPQEKSKSARKSHKETNKGFITMEGDYVWTRR